MKPNNDMKKRLSKTIFRNLIVPLLALGAFAIMALMSKGPSSSAPQQQQNAVQQQTTEVPAEKSTEEVKTKTPAENGEDSEYTVIIGSNDIEQEEGWVYVYEYTLDGKTIGVEEMNGWPVNIINWGENVKEKDFNEILNSPKTVKKFIEKQQLAE